MAARVKTELIRLKDFVWSKPIQTHPKPYSTVHFKEVLVSDVFKQLKNLSRRKITGYDDLPPGLLKDSARCIARPLTHVINSSLTTSIVPEDFKIGIITPIFKSGVKSDLDNYRPVTVLHMGCSEPFAHTRIRNHPSDREKGGFFFAVTRKGAVVGGDFTEKERIW